MGNDKKDFLSGYFENVNTGPLSFEGKVAMGLSSKRNKEKKRSKIYASEGGLCARKNVYMAKAKGEYTFSASSTLYTTIGTTVHSEVYKALEKQEILLYNDYRLPDIDLYLGAEVDAIIYNDERVYGLEIKTCGALPSSIKPEHKAQATLYQFITGFPFIVYYVSRNVADYTGEVLHKTFYLNVSEEYTKAVVQNVIMAKLSLDYDIYPLRSSAFATNKFPCNNCAYSANCYSSSLAEDATIQQMEELFESSDDLYYELKALTKNRRNGILNFITLNTNREYVRNILSGDWSNL